MYVVINRYADAAKDGLLVVSCALLILSLLFAGVQGSKDGEGGSGRQTTAGRVYRILTGLANKGRERS